MQTVDEVEVGMLTGLRGDYRGSLKPGRNKRQVTVMTAESWAATLADLGLFIAWELRRVNLLVDRLRLEETTGARLAFPGGVVLEVAPGLKAALLPHWRGGVTARVIAEGRLRLGDEVEMLR